MAAYPMVPVRISGKWLSTGQRLQVALVKPPLRNDFISAVQDDLERPDAMKLAEHLLQPSAGKLGLKQFLNKKPGLLLFPEYAFGSGQFQKLNTLVKGYPYPLICIAGFGATLGESIQAGLLAKVVLPTWRDEWVPWTGHRYNGAWCWVRESDSDPRVYLLLKHRPAQRAERYKISNWGDGRGSLLLHGDDLLIAPLLCSDFVLDQLDPESHLRQVADHIAAQEFAQQAKIVAGLMCDHNPHHPEWMKAVSRLVVANQRVAVLNCNHEEPTAIIGEVDDGVRCGSGLWLGGKINEDNADHTRLHQAAPGTPLGCMLRQPEAGFAVGEITWEVSGSGQFSPFDVKRRELFTSLGSPVDTSATRSELLRWCSRAQLIHDWHPWLMAQLRALRQHLHDQATGKSFDRLWPGLDIGPVASPEIVLPIDVVARLGYSLQHGLVALAALRHALQLEPQLHNRGKTLIERCHFERPRSRDAGRRCFLIWTPKDGDSHQMRRQLDTVARDWTAHDATLIVVTNPLKGRMKSEYLLLGSPNQGHAVLANRTNEQDSSILLSAEEEIDQAPPEKATVIDHQDIAPGRIIDYGELENHWLKSNPARAEFIINDLRKELDR